MYSSKTISPKILKPGSCTCRRCSSKNLRYTHDLLLLIYVESVYRTGCHAVCGNVSVLYKIVCFVKLFVTRSTGAWANNIAEGTTRKIRPQRRIAFFLFCAVLL